jgi:hypothetical protein
LRTDSNVCKVGRSFSVVWNSLIVLRITHLSNSSISVLIFLLGLFCGVCWIPSPLVYYVHVLLKCVSVYLRTHQ